MRQNAFIDGIRRTAVFHGGTTLNLRLPARLVPAGMPSRRSWPASGFLYLLLPPKPYHAGQRAADVVRVLQAAANRAPSGNDARAQTVRGKR